MVWRQNASFGNLTADKLKINSMIQAAINTTGDVYYVHSTNGSDGGGKNGKSPDSPFASIDYAVGKCTASQGDVIVVMTGHTESVVTDGGLTVDVAGITIVGLGEGDSRS